MQAQPGEDPGPVRALARSLVYHQIAYVHALRQHLRGLAPWEQLTPLLGEAETAALKPEKNVPVALQMRIGILLHQARSAGWIQPLEWHAIDTTVSALANAQGGTERIKNTPMPKQYDYFPMLFVQIYCVLLPLGLVENLGWFTPLGSTVVGFMFLALDRIGRDLEDPFDNTIYDLPLTSIATGIEINLRQMLAEPDLPPPVSAVHGVLW